MKVSASFIESTPRNFSTNRPLCGQSPSTSNSARGPPDFPRASNLIPTANRSGTSLCTSAATSPCRPCVFTTRASVTNSPLGSAVTAHPRVLLDDLEGVALAGAMAGGAEQRTQSAGCAPLAPDHFAHIALGHFQFDHAIVEFFDEDLVGRVDQRLGDQFDERAHISGALSHIDHS